MKRLSRLFGLLVVGALAASGCGGTDPISTAEFNTWQTLVVAYGDPGPSPDPCNDALPLLDGLGPKQEWDLAQPLFLRMTGPQGNGGEEFFLELRAVWTDEGRFQGGTNRIYFLVRYEDDDADLLPDALVYAIQDPSGLFRSGPEVPQEVSCAEWLLDPNYWLRINPEATEDQIMILLTEVADPSQPSPLVQVNQSVIDKVGISLPSSSDPIPGLPVDTHNVDLWIWRAGRTNLQPVPQYPDWATANQEGSEGVPEAEYSTFLANAGFADDAWIDASGTLRTDNGQLGYVRNFGLVNALPVPDRLHKCEETSGRDDDDETQTTNRGLPRQLALWDPEARRFRCEDVDACSRPGRPARWGSKLPTVPRFPPTTGDLVLGTWDYVTGWRIRSPYNPGNPSAISGRDVRARAAYGTTQEKGFPVRTLEVMRQLDTGNTDDLAIDINKFFDEEGRPRVIYRMTIAVYDRSSRVASGSTEVRLQFEAPTPKIGVVRRCQ